MQILKIGQAECKFITRQSIQLIQQKLGNEQQSKQYSQLFHNYESILSLLQSILNENIPLRFQKYLSNLTLRALNQQFSISAIFYALLIKIYKYNPKLVNHSQNEKHKYFISDEPTEATILLESLVNILEEAKITSRDDALKMLKSIALKIQQSINIAKNDAVNIIIQRETDGDFSTYKYRFPVSGSGGMNYQEDDLIYSSNTSYFGARRQFYCELFKNMQKHFGRVAAEKIIEEAMFSFGAVSYLKTMKLSIDKVNVDMVNNEFLMEVPVFPSIANISHFQISITFIKIKEKEIVLELNMKFNSERITSINLIDFHKSQRELTNSLGAQSLTSKLVCVQNLIYQIDGNSSKKLGKGAYGAVFKCQSLQLFNYDSSNNTTSFLFKRRWLAAKQLNIESDEITSHQIPLNRQHLILHLIKELKHRESIKKIKRECGVQVERNLIGIDRIIPMVQYFKIASLVSNQKKQESYYIIFELGQTTLSSKSFLDNFYKTQNYFQKLYSIFYSIFEGLNFLHYEINHFYHNELNRYYKRQEKDKNNFERDNMEELSEDGRNGIYHRDMKPSNIVINYNEKYEIVSLYLIDFGMAKITDFNKSKESTNCGSAYYIAPEVRNGAAYNEKVDIWSVGVFLYEMYIKNSKKLYSNTLMHSMNSVNDKLEDSINGVTNSDWKRWVSKVLKINAEEREKSNQILQFLVKHQIYLKQVDLLQLKQEFEDGEKYLLTQFYQNGSPSKQTSIRECKTLPVPLEQMISNKQEYLFTRFNVGEYLLNNVNTPQSQYIFALASLFHLKSHGQQTDLKKLIEKMSSLNILTTKMKSSSDNVEQTLIVIKNGQRKGDVMLKNVNEIQQNIKFAQINSENSSQKRFVLLLTNKILKLFSPKSEFGQQEKNRNYCYGQILQQNSYLKSGKHLFQMCQNFPHETCQVKFYNKDYQLFLIQCHSNRFEIIIPHEYARNLPINRLPLSQIKKIWQELLDYMRIYKKENTGNTIIINETEKQIQSEQNFTQFMSILRNQDKIIFSLNENVIKNALDIDGCFSSEIKGLLRQLINLQVELPYRYKIMILHYFKSSSFKDFQGLRPKFENYLKYPRSTITFAKQLEGELSYMLSNDKLSKIKKLALKTIIQNVLKLKGFYQKQFSPLAISHFKIQITDFIIISEILFEEFKTLPQKLKNIGNQKSNKQRLNYAAGLGLKFLQMFSDFKIDPAEAIIPFHKSNQG